MAIILAIETSCDETSVAILSGQTILSHVTFSQINQHKQFGGVMPELASRLHTEVITLMIDEAVKQANTPLSTIDAFAFTRGPGLIGALHVGLQAAKTLALIYGKPCIPVHHLAAHIEAGHFTKPLIYPYMALLVSGGHTELIYVSGPLQYKRLGGTRDDAVGESYDKVARLLDLGYPGGPKLDALAKLGQPRYPLPTPLNDDSDDFSFSGLKTAVYLLVEKLKVSSFPWYPEDIAASFQHVVMHILVKKSIRKALALGVKQLVVGGGVSANSYLRSLMQSEGKKALIDIVFPPFYACTDNAAMIGLLAQVYYQTNLFGTMKLNADPNWKIEDAKLF